MIVRSPEAQYLFAGRDMEVVATCRKCGTLNERPDWLQQP
jgi:hypothetical protein